MAMNVLWLRTIRYSDSGEAPITFMIAYSRARSMVAV